ncbi:NADPH-dependent FMN reductase [Sphaerisporangium sp. NPDC005289]|uniref:NADPH-dependent FMN reductase n=1 Tax=Sphaerisporangium sp. NPDC005289 TaxID=3155247 RepID=UPI0033A1F9DE
MAAARFDHERKRMTYTVGYIVGSLSRKSINRTLAVALSRLAPPDLRLTEIPIGELPLYSHDHDSSYPAVAREFKDAIEAADALLFVTPEYNRSIPGALKNAIDWATRPYGSNVLNGKPSAIIGASPGPISTAVAQQHLKTILSFTDSPVMGQPEAYIQFTKGLIDEGGDIQVPSTAAFLSEYLRAFAVHIRRHHDHPAGHRRHTVVERAQGRQDGVEAPPYRP